MARVLVIDDDPDIRESVRDMLAACGHSVTEAGNGAVGLDCLAVHSVDLVLMDLLMPQKEGIETIREIRETLPHMKIIAMSGCDAKQTYLSFAKEFGADAILAKPFLPSALLEAIGSALTPDWQSEK